jgi:uncharacterized repeat protein (TIGR03837 family)
VTRPRSWDLFCHVVDNFGDAGVCWRLASDLARRGEAVRLWIDDPEPLAFMAAQGDKGVEVVHWRGDHPTHEPADIVVEAFGCELPATHVGRMAARPRPPIWVNLEHLSAETWVERSHGLPSPQRNGLIKWFFFPGFTPRTGGLLRETGLLDARVAFERGPWLAAHGIGLQPLERLVVLFCYDNPRLSDLLAALADRPTLLLATPGFAQRQLATIGCPPGVRTQALPWLDQPDFDCLLWCGDINIVRGEDSVVRAIWAGAPFVWHIYPQHDLAHDAKLMALLDRVAADAPVSDAQALTRLWRRFNGLEPGSLRLPDPAAWGVAVRALRSRLAAQPDLTTQLLDFVSAKS